MQLHFASLTTPDGILESFEYDERGNGISHTNREGITTQYAYSPLGQIIRSTDVLSGITQYVYDELGNITAIVDPMERIERFTYDSLDRIVGISNHAGTVTAFTYDPASRLIAIQDNANNITRYSYDSFGYLESEILPSGQKRMLTFQQGKLTSLRREDGVDFTFGYSLAGDMISKSVGNRHTLYEYDKLGNALSIDKRTGTAHERIEYVYDLNANIVLENQGDESVVHAYSHDGSKRSIGYVGMHYALLRDDNRNVTAITQGGRKFAFEYNTSFAQTALTYPNKIHETSAFDPLGRFTKRDVSHGIGKSELLYDKSSLIVSKNDIRYIYDESKQLIGASDVSYQYDKQGNRMHTNAPQCVYDPLGRLIQKQTEESITTYDYDMEGYLVGYARIPVIPYPDTESSSLHLGDGLPIKSGVTMNFTYDPLGRRRTKRYQSFVIPNSIGDPVSSSKDGFPIKVGNDTMHYHHRYLHAGDNIVAIYDVNTDTLLATLLHEEDVIDSPLCINVHPQEPMSSEESIAYEAMDESAQFLFTQSRIKRYYYHRDYQNSILALSDDDANVVERYTYDAYGNITQEEHYEPINTLNPYRYTGREFDTDDLYYYRARYYDPTLGAFITPDPIGFLGGDMNLHRYVGNDPINYVDPSGLIILEALEGIAGFADSLTMGASGKIAEVINTKIYGASIAQATTAQIANSTAGQVGGVLADVVTLPKTAVKKLAQKGVKELAQNNAKQAVKKIEKKSASKPGKDGAKVGTKQLPKKKVKCFEPKDKHDAKEFDKQLKNQQDGLNNMSADEYLAGRSAFSGIKCKDGKAEHDSNWDKSQRPKRDKGKVDKKRSKHKEKLVEQLTKDMHADPEGEADRIMDTLAALHNPDMIAGGVDTFDKNSAISMGDKSVNSSIGSQWKGRIGELDAEACKAKSEGKGKDKMNAELNRCPKK